MKDFTEAQRTSFQDRLPERVAKKDVEGKLVRGRYYCEYYYGKLDFGEIMTKPDKSDLMFRYSEATDNAGDQIPLLFFSRPYNPIYVIYPERLYWVDMVRPAIYIDTSMAGRVCIASLENFLEGVPFGVV